MLALNLLRCPHLLFAPMRNGGPPGIDPEEKKVVFGTDSFCCGGWQAKESRLCSAWRMCGSSWPVVALCPGGGCVCAGMGAGPGCAAGAGDAEAVSESVVELSEDVDVMDVSGLSAKQNRGSDQGGLLKLGF